MILKNLLNYLFLKNIINLFKFYQEYTYYLLHLQLQREMEQIAHTILLSYQTRCSQILQIHYFNPLRIGFVEMHFLIQRVSRLNGYSYLHGGMILNYMNINVLDCHEVNAKVIG